MRGTPVLYDCLALHGTTFIQVSQINISKRISTKEVLQIIYNLNSDSEHDIFDDGDDEIEQYLEPVDNDKVMKIGKQDFAA